MKVTMLSNSKGGVFTATMQWAEGLARKSCDINIFFLTQSEQAKRLMSSERIHFEYFTFSNFLPNPHAIIACAILDFCRGRMLQFLFFCHFPLFYL